MSALDRLGPHENGLRLQAECQRCVSLTGFIRHYHCRLCILAIPWCNGASDDIDREFGGICDKCAADVLNTRGEP